MPTPHHILCSPTTRLAERLAQDYGHASPEVLAGSLPPKALAIDIGAGLSNFGETIAGLRPDVRWVNMDLRYSPRARISEHRAVARRQAVALNNMRYIAADVLAAPFAPGSFDRVYSSMMLPHLSLTSPDFAARAVHTMAGLLKDDGRLCIIGHKGSLDLPASDYLDQPDQFVDQVMHASKFGPVAEKVVRFLNLKTAMSVPT